MIIGLIGPKLSGKGTAADYLTEKHGAAVYHMSGILTEFAQRLHLPNSRANLIAIVTALRKEFGEDILAQTLKKDIEASDDNLAVIDGIRMPSEVDLFSELDGFTLLYVDASIESRYERAIGRGEKEGESEMTLEQFKEEESAVTERGIAGLRNRADHVIENYTTLEEFYEKISEIVDRIQ